MFPVIFSRHAIPRLLLLSGFLFTTHEVIAENHIDHHISGFATLGLVSSDNPDLIFRRDITQDDGSHDGQIEWKTDSLLGLQWQTRWSHQIDTTIQIVAKDRYENNLESAIEWAFVRYRPVDGLDFRVGRLGSDIFMLSEYRQVGYAFPWVRPPQDYYGLLSLYHVDGIDINKRFDLSEGTLNIKLFYGNSDKEYPTSAQSDNGVRLDFDPIGITFNLEWGHWKWRYTYADVTMNNNLVEPLTDALIMSAPLWPEAAEIANRMDTNNRSIVYNEFGVAYDNNLWWVQAEATQLESDSLIAPNSQHYYFSVGRRFGAFSVFGLTGRAHPEQDVAFISAPAGYPSPIAEQLAALAYVTEASLNGVRLDQKSYGLGVRWDFKSKMALKLQAEKFYVDQYGTNLWFRTSATPLTEDQTSTVISVAMDVLF